MVKDSLEKSKINCKIEIAEPQNSEGVIASNTFANIRGKTVAILKGQDGRDAIAQYLLQNKVKSDIYEVYKRQAAFQASDINEVAGQSIKCIIVTSIDIAEQVFECFPLDWLKDRIFMVASQRIYDYVLAKGAQQLVLSDSASTASIVSCANQLHLSGVLDDKR
jgi:uroporphyrinogen-III synthase